MAKLAALIAFLLDIYFFWQFFGPKSGEGFTVGWGNAMVMFLIMAVQWLTLLVMAIRALVLWRKNRYKPDRMTVALVVLCLIPSAHILIFNLVRH